MAEITAQKVKELREKSGAGMMDCKKALTESDGDFDKAMALLRERGEAIAVKRGGRAAKEGLIATAISADGKQGAIVELNCESDFVARNDDFKALADKVAQHAVTVPEGTELATTQLDGEAVADVVKGAIGKIGENIVLSRSAKIDSKDGVIVSYIHPPGKIGVLVEFVANGADLANNAEFQQAARGVAMHVAAANPSCVSRDQVDPAALEAEKDIFRKQAQNEGKPEAIIEKIMMGRINKYYGEVCLLEQAYVQDPEKKVEAVVKEAGKAQGADVSLNRFIRYQLGEGADTEGAIEE